MVFCCGVALPDLFASLLSYNITMDYGLFVASVTVT